MTEFIAFILFVLLVVSVYQYQTLLKKNKQAEKDNDLYKLKANEAQRENTFLQQKVDQLTPYQDIADAEVEAKKILDEANATVKQTQEDVRESIKKSKERSEKVVQGAIEQSKRILDTARARAEEIAGDAYEAKGKAELYQKTVKAMENIINGYGDKYLIPSASIIDDLAEGFSHKDAGIQLKRVRLVTKQFINNGLAADCDYVETNRRETAIRFVLDAFNGKVDSALSMVKHDNYGKLRQEIEDAYTLVNKNGKAFRDARVNPDYLNSRLDELKWAVAVNELKIIEREEQRAIKEAMREEERARREYEKAIKDAEKEERLLKQAMTEAEAKLLSAHDEEKSALENQLRELQEKFNEVEERNQRAISMAQQTRTGHVYVISNIGSFGEDVFKIGMTRRLEPLDRVKELGDASVPFEFDVHAMIHSKDAPTLETDLHKIFANSQINKVNTRKEFFRLKLGDIKRVVEDRNIETHWTMKAEAMHYRESLTLSGVIYDDVGDYGAITE
tara:strand:- start:3956 stop:5470 length:1515 start_codon:yes stop_codon:yes gene_type:complete